MPTQSSSKTVTTTTRPARPPRNRKRNTRRTTTTTVVSPKQNRNPRRRRARTTSSMHPLLHQYVSCCAKPWDCSPVRLGFGTAVPTHLASAYARFEVAVAGDGSFAVAVLPYVGVGGSAGILFNNGGVASTTWSHFDYANQAGIISMFESARVLGVGIRAITQQPMTAAPGLFFSSAQSFNLSDFRGGAPLSVNNCFALPSTRVGNGRDGGSAVGLPEDLAAFNFNAYAINGLNPGTTADLLTDLHYTVPVLAAAGLVAGSLVTLEVCLCLETMLKRTQNLSMHRAITVQSPSLVETGTSADGVLRTLRQAIPTAVAVGAALYSPTVWEPAHSGVLQPTQPHRIQMPRSNESRY